ncbi:hypothetical protein D6829_02685 [Candidatus Pacearchaeota archaeon]|nr:MAG: hypothetical protein D6829_02685 [Candidatus Pacearchaeota archaeon]
MDKRGQFFLFASVVISAIIISLGSVINSAKANPEPMEVYDLGSTVKEEAGKVIDYEIYRNLGANVALEPFIGNVSQMIREKDPSANFMVVYGNQSALYLRNYGREGVYAGGRWLKGGRAKIKGTIRIRNGAGYLSKRVSFDYGKRGDFWNASYIGKDVKNITVTVRGQNFTFEILPSRQVIFIIQKDSKDESFVSVQ